MYDAIIVGGGPAGLSAALVLGRCRRSVLLCDSGQYRNDAAVRMHGFLSRDGVTPADLRRLGREQLAPYGVEIREVLVTGARALDHGFEIALSGGDTVLGKKVLIATGIVDHLPEIPGIEDLYGKSVHHCPYCDGWEERDRPIAVLGSGEEGAAFAATMRTWSDDVALCTNGPAGISREERVRLARRGVPVYEGRIARLEGHDGHLTQIVFDDGTTLARAAMFVKTEKTQRSDLAETLGAAVDPKKGVRPGGKFEETRVKGVFVAGDASEDLLLAIVAASEGAKAAYGIHCELLAEERDR